MEIFNDKGAVITGAASGIGFAMAERFLKEGMKVVIADVDAASLNVAADKLRLIADSVTSVVTDVANAESVRQLAQTAKATLGDINIVCNNAGVISAGSLWDSSVDEYNWVMGVNLWGIIHGIREFVPILKAQSCESHIVNTASMGALATMAYSGIYYMTKAAALSLSETLYQELLIEAPHVGVTCLCPEFIKNTLIKAKNFSNKKINGRKMKVQVFFA